MRAIAKTTTTLDPAALKVLTFREWCKLNSFSIATGKRLMRARKGPKVVRLSERRIGIRMIDHVQWSDQRVRA